jgi:hypothetical protein
VVSSEKIPAGAVRLGMEFLVTGKYEIAPDLTAHGIEGFEGRVALYINDRPAGSGEIEKTVPFGWSLTGDGLCCGFDSETPVSDQYGSAFRFTGKIDRVIVSVSGEPYQNTAKEIERAFLIE